MGKRPRTPHFITGIGDGNVNANLADSHNNARVPNDDIFLLGGNGNAAANKKDSKNSGNAALPDRYIRTRNERLMRLEEPLLASDHWRDVFGSGDPSIVGKPSTPISGPWQVSAFAILGMIVVISAIFLHMISESSSESNSTPYAYRRRQRHARRMYKTRKKKTDEWSDDEEEEMLHNSARLLEEQHHAIAAATAAAASPALGEAGGHDAAQFYPCYYQQQHQQQQPGVAPRYATHDHRLRRTSNKDPHTPPTASGGRNSNNYYLPVNPTYVSPSANLMNLTPGGVHRRGVSPRNSFNSGSQGGPSPGNNRPLGSTYSSNNSSNAYSPSGVLRATAPLSARYRVPPQPDVRDVFPAVVGAHHSGASNLQGRLPTPLEEAQLVPDEGRFYLPGDTPELNARPLNSSNFSSFASLEADQVHQQTQSNRSGSNHSHPSSRHGQFKAPDSDQSLKLGELLGSASSQRPDSNNSASSHHLQTSFASAMMGSVHQQSLLLSPGNYEVETPRLGNARKVIEPSAFSPGLVAALQPPHGSNDEIPYDIPFIPTLSAYEHRNHSPRLHAAAPPPRSVLMDELRLFQMESGNSMHWEAKELSESQDVSESHASLYGDYGDAEMLGAGLNFGSDQSYEDDDTDISIPSGDPRKSIVHKRSNLTMATDASTSLLSSIDFEELKLQEVIGGGGFGQVWRATWRGTPVAVKLLTGSAQNQHIARAILEEFKAEINLLKGMRHPNICLYMGASMNPPNRAIVTELAANGSVWDSLRLPLMPPYVPADGTQKGAWPLKLYIPDQHGAPPSSTGIPRVSAPIPPKGTWPWMLVKRVANGAARGMAYLHSGNPPVLHRDLKSANLLLDESYTTKVCDFGLSRLKAQARRSMTGNCGTVQWMAPEVLANMSYDEKADVFSFGIILWELLTRECPYDGMTAIQCALAVLNRDKRPEIPKWCPPALHALIKACVKKEPDLRPSFAQIILALDAMDD